MKKALGMLALMLVASAMAGCASSRNNDWYGRSNRSMDTAEINDSMDNSIGGSQGSGSLIKLP